MTLAPKTRLGNYEIVGPLGAGGMGEVYRAKDLRLGREVAIKVLPETLASSPDRLARFEREARAVAALNHPNIVVLHSVEDVEGVRFLTMELVEGQPLSELVSPGGLPLSRLLEISIPLADALVAAHERGVVHRDLKPGNVMVTREGRVKVLDFGLAKIAERETPAHAAPLEATTESPISGDCQVLGTVPYMAPEQLRGEAADARSDLFALGILLYELATGRRPFTGETPADVSSSILRDTPAPLGRLRADLPSDFDRIVTRCLRKSPRERFQTVLDVSNELRSLRRDLERREHGTPEKSPSGNVASIAVLPFVNRSASTEDEYFSDGLADELLNVLAKIKGLRVSARSSSFQFKGKNEDPASVGAKLNVAAVLEGSVRKAGNRVRISVQLVNVSDGFPLWSETYDRTLDDIFAVQDDIARSVVKELRTTLLGEEADSDASGQAKAEVAKAAKGRGTNPEAHRLYLLARHLSERVTRVDLAKAIGHLREAVRLDPDNALAWVELSLAYSREADQGLCSVAEGYGRAREAAEHALSLEPDLGEAHARMAWIRLVNDWDWRSANESIRRALELAPGSAQVLHVAGGLYMILGRLEEASEFNRRALEQDPLSAATHSNIGVALYLENRYAEAEGVLRRALELAPLTVGAHAIVGLSLFGQGRGEDGLAEVMREPDEALRLWALALLHSQAGRREESGEALRELTEKYSEDSAFQIAEVHAARNEVDAAFEWLDRAYAQRDGGVPGLRASPYLRSLRDDPRWSLFLKKIGLED